MPRANTTNAATRQPVPPASRQATKTGTSARRSTVSALAALTSPGPGRAGRDGAGPAGCPGGAGWAGRAAPCGGSPPGSTGPPGQRVWPGRGAAGRASAVRSTPSDPVTLALTMSPTASGTGEATVVTPSTSGAWWAARPS